MCHVCIICFFFFNDTATTEIYTLSLHDALPIYRAADERDDAALAEGVDAEARAARDAEREVDLVLLRELLELGRVRQELADRKSTRLNSSHANISYAVFCLKKKK